VDHHQHRLLAGIDASQRPNLEAMLSRIEIEITTACNLKCHNCDRSSRQAVTAERMSVEQVAHFVDESLALAWVWRKIALLGGEPTLHPGLFEILDELDRYRARYPHVTIEVISNGYGPRVNRVLDRLPDWVALRNTRKTSVDQPFVAYNLAPQDLVDHADADYSGGCSIPYRCGMALTRYGYYPCGAGASIDRVFGFLRGVGSLREVTPQGLVAEFSRLCRHCGHFHGRKADGEVMSKSWSEAYVRWHSRRPTLPLYASKAPSPGAAGVPVRDDAGGRG
jgi:hypothetical protein